MNSPELSSELAPARWARAEPGLFWVVFLVGAVWLTILAADWWGRFSWYNWHRHLILRPTPVFSGPTRPFTTNWVAASRGGDLTRLVGIPSFNARYERERPAHWEYTDEQGYRNIPPTRDREYPVVVVGDSYMNAGETMTNMFSARLSAVSGMDIYNHAWAGAGPFQSVSRFFQEERFREHPPRVLIWGFIEREIAGDVFSGLSFWMREERKEEVTAARTRFLWREFLPRRLKTGLPNTSLFAQATVKIWNVVRYWSLGDISPQVIPAFDSKSGTPLLFYQAAIESMKWGPEERKIEKVAFHIEDVNNYCRDRNMEMLVVLIPDKEGVYRENLSDTVANAERPLRPSCLYELERALQRRNIRVVNLLDPFREEAARGNLLYWPDDTHWNSEGIDYAARLAWEKMADLFGGDPESAGRKNPPAK